VSPSFFFSVPETMPLTVWGCHPVAAITSATVAPSARRKSSMTWACFDPARGAGDPATCSGSTGSSAKAAQSRWAAALRSLNRD
jgi:hypothetical protein